MKKNLSYLLSKAHHIVKILRLDIDSYPLGQYIGNRSLLVLNSVKGRDAKLKS